MSLKSSFVLAFLMTGVLLGEIFPWYEFQNRVSSKQQIESLSQPSPREHSYSLSQLTKTRNLFLCFVRQEVMTLLSYKLNLIDDQILDVNSKRISLFYPFYSNIADPDLTA